MIFDMPADGLYIKLNDFGMNQIDGSFYKKYNINRKIVQDSYRDYFSIIYDVYNGANLGSSSLYRLLHKKKNMLKQIDKYFNKFLNVRTINRIIKNNKKRSLDWDWEKTIDPVVVELFGLKDIGDYISRFKKIFPHNNDHQIVEEYGTKN